MHILLEKCREVASAVTPVVILVLILHFTLAPLSGPLLFQFLLGAAAIMLGLSILLFGIEMGVLPFGNQMGATILKSNKLWFVIVIGFLLGFFINIAEPDLQVLAAQVASITGGFLPMPLILVTVSIGTGLMLALGITRIVKDFSLKLMFAIIYGIILMLAFFSSSDMLAISFDASGATTGALTTPLVLALSAGVAAMKRDSKSSEEDSFGLVGVMSTGAILGVLLLNRFVKTDNITGALELGDTHVGSLFAPFIQAIPKTALESLVALLPIVVILLIFQKVRFRMPGKAFHKVLTGFVYTYVGLVIFLLGAHAGFMHVANIIGYTLASYDNKAILVGMGFLMGMLVILTEPAVYILTHQIEDVTSGHIKRKIVLLSLSIGVAVAVGLAMLRIVVPGIQLWHYLLPGFGVALVLMRFVPKLFVGIAFDSGGVASGPMTATFVLAFAQGASEAIEYSDLLRDSFGVISMVAMTPLIALQVLGLIYRIKAKKSGVGNRARI